MSILVPIALFGWIPAILLLFMVLPARKAVVSAFVGAWLFLPMAGYKIAGLPDYTKVTATTAGVLLATLVYDSTRISRLRLSLVDVPMVLWCIAPSLSSLSNGLGPWDAVSSFLYQGATWGLPYLIGRMYFTSPRDVGVLAAGIIVGGIVYVPLCLYEIKMSPQLHRIVYGFFPHDFAQSKRFGGWRPNVFMQHGLMVGMWMAAAAMLGVWLWWRRSLTGWVRQWAAVAVPLLAGTALLVKSVGAIALCAGGLVILAFIHRFKAAWPVVLIAAAPVSYEIVRGLSLWDGRHLVELAAMVSAERADSLAFRLNSENLLVAKALARPVFGWGGWGSFMVDDFGNKFATPDGLWVIVLGKYGLVGLATYTAAMITPGLICVRRVPVKFWGHPDVAPLAGIVILTLLYAVDNLFNAMVNPIFILGLGAVAGAAVSVRTTSAVAAPKPGGVAVA